MPPSRASSLPVIAGVDLDRGTTLDAMIAIMSAPPQKEQEEASGRIDWAQWQDDPEGFAEFLGFVLTPAQKEICRSIIQRRETDVQAAHGVGKTWLAALLTIWWARCRGKVITTAPTKRQVEELLWSEVRKMWARHRDLLGGDCLATSLRFSEDFRAYGFTATDHSTDSFQGVHDSNLLAIQDEAGGISNEIDDGFDSCIAGTGNRGLRIGNPVRLGTRFQKHCRRRGTMRISAFSHPNVAWAYEKHPDGQFRLRSEVDALLPRDEEGYILEQEHWPESLPRDIIPGAVTVAWIEKHRRDDGESSSFWRSRVCGEFPTSNTAALVPRAWWDMARARYDEEPEVWDARAQGSLWSHGFDIGDGGDPHATCSRRGPVLYAAAEHPTRGDREDTDRAIGIGLRLLQERPGEIHVDRVGVGAGVLSGLLTAGVNAHEVNNGGSAKQKDRYENARAEDFWELRELFRKGEIAVAPLGEEEEDRLRDELDAIMYEDTRTGKVKMEPKDNIKKRLHRSPNLADACAMAFRVAPKKRLPPKFAPTGTVRSLR